MIKYHESLNYLYAVVKKQEKILESRLLKIISFDFITYYVGSNSFSLCISHEFDESVKRVAEFEFSAGKWTCLNKTKYQLSDNVINRLLLEIEFWDREGEAL